MSFREKKNDSGILIATVYVGLSANNSMSTKSDIARGDVLLKMAMKKMKIQINRHSYSVRVLHVRDRCILTGNMYTVPYPRTYTPD